MQNSDLKNTKKNTTFTINADDLRQKVDLRDLVTQVWGQPVRKSGRYHQHLARWRDDGNKPSFTVYRDGFVDYGGSGERGDAFSFIMREFGLSYRDALAWLEKYTGAATPLSDQTRLNQVQRGPDSAHNEPPSSQWQQATQIALEKSQAYLWSDLPDARRVLDYLRDKRGLTDASIREAGYGYNPRWQPVDWVNPANGKAAYLAPGIIEPWVCDGVLWALRVRCRVGNLARTLNMPDETINGQPLDKYLNLAGSKQNGALYRGDTIQDGDTVLIVEGGFDAVLAAQALENSLHLPTPSPQGEGEHMKMRLEVPLHSGEGFRVRAKVVTFGSATNRPAPRRLKQLQAAGRIILLLDADAAGQAAQDKLIAALQSGEATPEIYTITLPAGKDVTDFIVEHGGDLSALVQDAALFTPPPTPLPELKEGEKIQAARQLRVGLGNYSLPVDGEGRGGVSPLPIKEESWDGISSLPDSMRSALLTYFRDATAPVMELLIHAARQKWLNLEAFTLRDLMIANDRAGYGLAQATVYRVIHELNGYFFSEVRAENPKNRDSTNEKNRRSSRQPGRIATVYRLLPRAQIHAAILAFAAPRIIEQAHPASGELAVLAEITPAMLWAVGYEKREAVDVLKSLKEVLRRVYGGQAEESRRTGRKIWAAMTRLKAALENPHSTPLPEGEILNNGAAYRAAFLRVTNNPDERRSRKAMRELVGVVDSGLGKVLQRANLRPAAAGGEFEVVALDSGDDLERQVQQAAYEVKGYPKRLIVEQADGNQQETPYEGRGSRPVVAAAVASGAAVYLKVQVANRYVVREADEPKIIRPNFVRPMTKTENAPPKPKRPAHVGASHDPQWVYEQLILALMRLRGAAYRWQKTDLIDTTTGELMEHPTAAVLIALILDVPLPDAATDITYRQPPLERISERNCDETAFVSLLAEGIALGGVLAQ